MELSEKELMLLEIIPYGKENRATRKELCQRIGVCDTTLRRMIRNIRWEGNVICSNPKIKGYWKPTERQEYQDFIQTMDNYAMNCFKASYYAKKQMKIHEDQIKGVFYE